MWIMWESIIPAVAAVGGGGLVLLGTWFALRNATRLAREERAEARRKDEFLLITDVYEQALALAIMKPQTPPGEVPNLEHAAVAYARLKLHGSEKTQKLWGIYVDKLKAYAASGDIRLWDEAGQATQDFVDEARKEFDSLRAALGRDLW